VAPTKKAKSQYIRVGVDRRRIGIGHLEDAGDTAQNSSAPASCQVFLVLGARLAQVDLRIDNARQDVEAPAVDHLCGVVKGSQPCNPALGDGDVALDLSVVIHDGSPFQNQVKCQEIDP
jgi:hypothetical protein